MTQTATILVIDDEPQIRKFLRISLASQGHKVLEAGPGSEGPAQAAPRKPDLPVSHDIRTLLTSMHGGVDCPLAPGDAIPMADRRELLQGTRDEAGRLAHDSQHR